MIVTWAWSREEVQPIPKILETKPFPWWTALVRRGEVLLVSDLNDLPEEASAEREYLRGVNAVSVAIVPLQTGAESFGCISFVSTLRRVSWTEDLVKRLKILAEIFSNAVIRQRAQEALEKVSGKLLDAQEKERSLIARELHDDICQRLTLLSLKIEQSMGNSDVTLAQADRMQEVWEDCSGINGDVQALSHELHSSMLDHLGMTAAVKNLCREFSQQQGVVVEFVPSGLPDPLPREVALCLFRVVQEALRNGVKHSGANRFEVCLRRAFHGIELEVRDAGMGFDVEKARRNGGLGLVSMQERVHLVKGTFAIDSRINGGTTIRARVPLLASMTTPTAHKKVVEEVSNTT